MTAGFSSEFMAQFEKQFVRGATVILIIFACFILLQIGFGIIFFMAHAYIKSLITLHPKISAIVLTSIALLIGRILANWKQIHLLSYGSTECAFGLLLTFNSVLNIAPGFELARILAVIGGVYAITRGFNNIIEYRAKSRLQRRR